MKRLLLTLGSFLALTSCWMVAGVLAQEPKVGKPAPTGTKVAFVNIGKVVESIQDEELEAQTRKAVEPFMQKGRELTAEIGRWKKEFLDLPKVTPADREAYQQKLTKNKREMEEVGEQIRKVLAKLQSEQLVAISKRMNKAAQEYAKANGFHAVLAYSGTQIEKTVETGGITPLYIDPKLDITTAIIDALNVGKKGDKK
jgi:Skp family chaperone for outer membrane proteins